MKPEMNTDLGTNADMLALVSRIKSFDFNTASTPDNMALACALKLVAAETVAKFEEAENLTRALTEKLAQASVATELAAVLGTLRPVSPEPKRGWFWRRNRAK